MRARKLCFLDICKRQYSSFKMHIIQPSVLHMCFWQPCAFKTRTGEICIFKVQPQKVSTSQMAATQIEAFEDPRAPYFGFVLFSLPLPLRTPTYDLYGSLDVHAELQFCRTLLNNLFLLF